MRQPTTSLATGDLQFRMCMEFPADFKLIRGAIPVGIIRRSRSRFR
jgi:hypothetical protein